MTPHTLTLICVLFRTQLAFRDMHDQPGSTSPSEDSMIDFSLKLPPGYIDNEEDNEGDDDGGPVVSRLSFLFQLWWATNCWS